MILKKGIVMEKQPLVLMYFKQLGIFALRLIIIVLISIPFSLIFGLLDLIAYEGIAFNIYAFCTLAFVAYKKRSSNKALKEEYANNYLSERYDAKTEIKRITKIHKKSIIVEALACATIVMYFLLTDAKFFNTNEPYEVTLIFAVLLIVLFPIANIYLWYYCEKKWHRFYKNLYRKTQINTENGVNN